MRGASSPLHQWLGDRLWSFELNDQNELEERVDTRFAREQATSWLFSVVLLSTSFAAMVLFAIAR